MSRCEQSRMLMRKAAADEALVDRLTPYATLYRYEDPPQVGHLDRLAAREFIRRMRAWVEAELPTP